MFGLGFGELLVVLVIALIFLGPDKIPKTARTVGKWVHELKHSLDDIKEAFEKDVKQTTKPVPSEPAKKETTVTTFDSTSSNGKPT